MPDGGEWQYGYVSTISGTFVVLDADTIAAAMADESDRRWISRRRVVYGPAEPLSKPSDTPPASTTDQTIPNVA